MWLVDMSMVFMAANWKVLGGDWWVSGDDDG